MTSRVRVSARSRPSPPLYPHFNRPLGFLPCIKSCLVGGSDKYHIYIYIYIYIYANFIKHNRHFMPTYSLLDPFEFSYYFYRIRGELIKVLSIVLCIPSTFCPTLGHHQRRICYKNDVTFVLAYYYCVRTSLLLEIMALAFKCNSVNSASSKRHLSTLALV